MLHLVPEPEKMLSEVKRVLKKDGKFGCSVLGALENCTFFLVAKDIFTKHDLVNQQGRSIHYLGERQKLMEVVGSNGFDVIYCWLADGIMDVHDEDDV